MAGDMRTRRAPARKVIPTARACSKDGILDKVRIMPKVTSKLQLTVPKKIADQYGIKPGDELEWIPAGKSIRVETVRREAPDGARLTPAERLAVFDASTKRRKEREETLLKGMARPQKEAPRTNANRGWTREEIYGDRGLPR